MRHSSYRYGSPSEFTKAAAYLPQGLAVVMMSTQFETRANISHIEMVVHGAGAATSSLYVDVIPPSFYPFPDFFFILIPYGKPDLPRSCGRCAGRAGRGAR